MTDLIKRNDALNLARLFHENYEQLAPQYGYKTRDDTKDFDPTTANGQLMIATCGAVLSDLPAVTTHRYAGESEASVYDRKGFPPIDLATLTPTPADPVVNLPEHLCTFPSCGCVAKGQWCPAPRATEPAAIREAALQARIEDLVKERDYWMNDSAVAWDKCETRRLEAEAAEAKLTKAEAYLQKISRHANRSCAAIAAHALAELEGM